MDPQPEFQAFDHKTLVLDSYNSPSKGGNVDTTPVGEAAVPESIVDDPGPTLGRFAVPPGWLIRGMWITGTQGPLGTNHFEVTSKYGDEPYNGVEKDPSRGSGRSSATPYEDMQTTFQLDIEASCEP